MRKYYVGLLFVLCAVLASPAQKPNKPTASELYHELQKLNFLGSATLLATGCFSAHALTR